MFQRGVWRVQFYDQDSNKFLAVEYPAIKILGIIRVKSPWGQWCTRRNNDNAKFIPKQSRFESFKREVLGL